MNGRPFEHGLDAFLRYLDSESNPWDWGWTSQDSTTLSSGPLQSNSEGSMVVFLMIAALARTKTAVRLAVEAIVVVHSLGHKRWDVALFVAGMGVAELQVLFSKRGPSPRPWIVSLILSLGPYCRRIPLAIPRNTIRRRQGICGSKALALFLYRRRFWLAVSAMLIVGPMAFLPRVQSLFLLRPVRYLGRISYSLYLVHGLGNRTIESDCCTRAGVFSARKGLGPTPSAFVVSSSIYFPLILWVSDIFWRAIDLPSTETARWLERRCASR